MYTDSHAHISSLPTLADIDNVLHRAQTAGVSRIVNICTDHATLEAGLALQQKHPASIFLTAATTPHDVESEGVVFFSEVEKCAREKRLCAIGETGLDYHYEHSPRALQQEHLMKYFALAQEHNLPIVFHCREAFGDLFALADQYFRGGKAVLHCFTGTEQEAKGCLDRGWYISFSGIVTFKKSEALRQVAAFVPLESMVIETDTPYLAPQSRRSQVNEPAYLVETIEVLASIKNITTPELGAITSANASKFFAFPKLV